MSKNNVWWGEWIWVVNHPVFAPASLLVLLFVQLILSTSLEPQAYFRLFCWIKALMKRFRIFLYFFTLRVYSLTEMPFLLSFFYYLFYFRPFTIVHYAPYVFKLFYLFYSIFFFLKDVWMFCYFCLLLTPYRFHCFFFSYLCFNKRCLQGRRPNFFLRGLERAKKPFLKGQT